MFNFNPILSIICEHLLTLGSNIIIKLIDETVEYSVWNGFILF
jgi:hypothetical protein